MIVRNEERHLAACLSSIRALVDEIIIVDIGSTDSTIKIAKHFGARVFRERSTGDFAAARNHSIALAAASWMTSARQLKRDDNLSAAVSY